jgi:dTDP-4-amino-4,6-dideoxygalactose transaminase
MDEIMALANSLGIKVIEDCAQAHGAAYKGREVGSMGHAAAFSFCQDKIITTGGEGGLLATNDADLWERAWAYKDHGKSHRAVYNQQHPPGFRWLHESFGTNWRMTELQAAIGRIQLRKLPGWNARRRAHAALLQAELDATPGLRTPLAPAYSRHGQYRYYAYLDVVRLRSGWTRDRVVSEVSARGGPCFSGSCSEIYREKAFSGTGLIPREPLATAHELGETSLALLVHPTLEDAHVRRTADVLKSVLAGAID